MYGFSIRHPWVVLFAAMCVVGAAVPGLLRLRLRTDGHALIPAEAPEVVFDEAFRESWGARDQTIVVVDTGRAEGIYNARTLGTLVALHRALTGIEEIDAGAVTSLVTEQSDRITDALRPRSMLEPFPDTPELLARLKKDIADYRIYSGTLVSVDGSAVSILIDTPRGLDRSRFHERIRAAIAEVDSGEDEVLLAGAPIAESQLGVHILEDLLGTRAYRLLAELGLTARVGDAFEGGRSRVSLILLAMAVMGVVFFAAFGRLGAAVLPLMEVGACLVFTFGLMGWLSVPVYLTVTVLPVILTAIGVADELHLFVRYRREVAERGADGGGSAERAELVRAVFREMWRPIAMTSVTSAAGFLSFSLSPIGPVAVFGVFAAVGIGFCWLWSMTVIPALLAMIPPGRLVRLDGGRRAAAGGLAGGSVGGLLGRLAGGFERLADWTRRHERGVWVGVVAVVAATPFGIGWVTVQDSWVDAFAPGSVLHRATTRVNEKFLGAHLLRIELDTGPVSVSGPISRGRIGTDRLVVDRSVGASAGDEEAGSAGGGGIEYAAGHPLTISAMVSIEAVQRGGQKRVQLVPIKHTTRVTSVVCTAERCELGLADSTDRFLKSVANMDVRGFRYEITPPRSRLTDPMMLEAVGRLESFIEEQTDCEVGGVQGLYENLAVTNYLVWGRDESKRHGPENARRLEKCIKRYIRLRGAGKLRQLLDRDRRRCTVTVFLKDANYVATGRLIDRIREYERARLEPLGVRLGLAGDVAVSQAMIGAIVETQIRSLLLSLGCIWLVTSLMSRSVVVGAMSLLPAGLAVAVCFGVMGAVGVPLGVATAMFSAMVIGIGVDYAIHFLAQWRGARRRGLDGQRAVSVGLARSGPAILVDAISIGLGFGVLMISQVPANRRLGGLVVVAVATCVLTTVVLLPILARRVGD